MKNSEALDDVIAERCRQVEAEGFDYEHDFRHQFGELASAGARYALTAVHQDRLNTDDLLEHYWFWERGWFKPSNQRRDLVKAAALILAEIEKMDGEGYARAS